MRRSAVAFAALLGAALTGCQSTPSPEPGQASQPAAEAAPAEALAPQTLAPGRCGLFLFEVREPNRFVLFEDENREVKIVDDGRVVTLGVTPQSGVLTTGERFRRVYLDRARNLTYTLTGRVGMETGSGLRLEEVLLRRRSLDGAELVRPLGGVRRCMEARPVAG